MALRMSLISLWSRAHHAVKRERNKPVANRCAHILAIEQMGCDTCVKSDCRSEAGSPSLVPCLLDVGTSVCVRHSIVPGPDWSRPLPQPLTFPDVLTPETLADV